MAEKTVYTLVAVDRGLLTVIDPNTGMTKSFRQRGINSIPSDKFKELVAGKVLHPRIMTFDEVPKGCRVYIECEPMMFGVRTCWYPITFKYAK